MTAVLQRPGPTDAAIAGVHATAYRVPSEMPESDGTFEWRETTMVVVEATAGGVTGVGYTYASCAAVNIIHDHIARALQGSNAMAVPACWATMVREVRNVGRPGVASMAVAAVDNALWDLKARILNLPLVTLLGAARASIPVYGSGGFTSYSIPDLEQQCARWVAEGINAVKMKVGRDAAADVQRVERARAAIGTRAMLFVDANGAYDRKQALAQAEGFAAAGVSWFEEPVSSDDVEGLRFLRDRVPPGMRIAAGEYAYVPGDFRRLLDAGAVDVLQADATRCGGITGFLAASALCDAYAIPLSAHTAPTLHAHVCCAAPRAIHAEYFHDHVRVEHLLFDGALRARDGRLSPDLTRPGMGLSVKRTDAARYAA